MPFLVFERHPLSVIDRSIDVQDNRYEQKEFHRLFLQN